ncbi:MAG TPA: ATP-binding protein [Acetobacteraceae bacterium]|nr:ATP-binding protein [Acetobacteraceae bacterium]
MIQVLEAPGLHESREGRRLADDIARRIELAAAISDALFGFTGSLEPLPMRLRSLAESVIALYADATQIIRLEVAAADVCPPDREDVILRIAHELVGNAVKHGMHMRLLGRISVRLAREAGMAVLSVANDGWRMEEPARFGEGLALVEDLVRAEGGTVRAKTRPQTLIEVRLPCEAALPLRRDRAPAEIRP